MPPPNSISNIVRGRKSARSMNEHINEIPMNKKFNRMSIGKEGSSLTNRSDMFQRSKKFDPESDPEIVNLPNFKYIWRTKFYEDEVDTV